MSREPNFAGDLLTVSTNQLGEYRISNNCFGLTTLTMRRNTIASHSLVRTSCGFTLIEMLVVVLIMGILAGAATPILLLERRRIQEAELRENLREIRNALDAYKRAWDDGRMIHKVDDSGYPHNLTELVDGVADVKSPSRQKMYFLRRLPRDPFAAPTLSAEQTWGMRSYASPPGAPEAGEDVYDIHSLNPGTGLDGNVYRGW